MNAARAGRDARSPRGVAHPVKEDRSGIGIPATAERRMEAGEGRGSRVFDVLKRGLYVTPNVK